MRILNYLLIFLLVLFGISFACLNAELVKINLYIGTFSMPLSLLLILILGLGLILGMLIMLFKFIRLKRENSKLKSRVKLAEKEVSNLRSIPLKDKH